MTDDNLNDTQPATTPYECQDCGYVTQHPSMLRSIPSCKKCNSLNTKRVKA